MIDGLDTTLLVELELCESPGHEAARRFLERRVLSGEETLALAPQVIGEFIHVVTDPRRFASPLPMDEAIRRSDFWWQAREVRRVHPSSESVDRALRLMERHHLGRKRILDTLLAATYLCAGIHRIVTTNARDYSTFEEITPVIPR